MLLYQYLNIMSPSHLSPDHNELNLWQLCWFCNRCSSTTHTTLKKFFLPFPSLKAQATGRWCSLQHSIEVLTSSTKDWSSHTYKWPWIWTTTTQLCCCESRNKEYKKKTKSLYCCEAWNIWWQLDLVCFVCKSYSWGWSWWLLWSKTNRLASLY